MFISCLFFFSSKVQNHCSSPSHTSPLEMIPPGITHLWTHHTLSTDIPFTVQRPPIQCMKSHEESTTDPVYEVPRRVLSTYAPMFQYAATECTQPRTNPSVLRQRHIQDIKRFSTDPGYSRRVGIEDITIRLIEGFQHPSFHIMDDMFS